MKQPPIGFTTRAKIVRWIDGDTLEVEVTRKITVRIEDFWCPEIHETKHPSEKSQGLQARIAVAHQYPSGTECTLFVPGSEDGTMKDLMTFGRVVGVVFVDGKDIRPQFIEDGVAFETKAELEKHLSETDDIRNGK